MKHTTCWEMDEWTEVFVCHVRYMVRTPKWKLVWDGQVEEASGLYNLADDPSELNNFISLEGSSRLCWFSLLRSQSLSTVTLGPIKSYDAPSCIN